VRGILRYALALTTAGIGFGIIAAFATTRLLGSLLFEVSPIDPTVLTVVSVFIAMVSLTASYLPARRAAGVDPMLALKRD
jgi:putative ABC transport system permease protein